MRFYEICQQKKHNKASKKISEAISCACMNNTISCVMYLERTWFVCGMWYVCEGVLVCAEGEVTEGTLATRLHHGSSHAGTLASWPCLYSVTYCL